MANNHSGFVATENTPLSIPASALLANDTDPNGYTLSISGVGNPTNGTVTYSAGTQTVTFVPTTGYTGAASFTYTITDGHGGTASATVTLTVNFPTASLFSAEAPSNVALDDGTPVELGVKFQTSVPGTITGIRFYKSPQATAQSETCGVPRVRYSQAPPLPTKRQAAGSRSTSQIPWRSRREPLTSSPTLRTTTIARMTNTLFLR